MSRRPEGIHNLLAQAQLARVTAPDLVRWAVAALSEGWDSPALVRLAALDLDGEPSVFEALSLFHEACEQLGIPLASGKEAVLRDYLCWVALQVAHDAMDPLEALDVVHRDVLNPLSHPGDLQDWCYLWERLHPHTFEELDDAGASALARRLAEEWTSSTEAKRS
jgi:hypothetical protein